MPKQKLTKRNYRMVTFKVYFDTDNDILDWWEGIDEGERSDALRDVIRTHLGKQPRQGKWLTIPELLEVRQDTLWIRDALNDMPGYLERLIQHVTASGAGRIALPQGTNAPMIGDAQPSTETALSGSDSERRARRMKRASW